MGQKNNSFSLVGAMDVLPNPIRQQSIMVVDFTIFNLVWIILYVNYDGNRCNSSIVVQA